MVDNEDMSSASDRRYYSGPIDPQRASERAADYDEVAGTIEEALDQTREALDAATTHNREVFLREQMSTTDTALLALLENCSIAAESAQYATRHLSVSLLQRGINATEVAKAAGVTRTSLYRWKRVIGDDDDPDTGQRRG